MPDMQQGYACMLDSILLSAGTTILTDWGEQGILFRDESKKDWATCVNLDSGITNVMDIDDSDYGTKFLNPSNPDVVSFLLDLLRDLASYKDLDGIVLDRCRYDDLAADFSDISRKAFENHIGRNVTNWPDDVLAPGNHIAAVRLPYLYEAVARIPCEDHIRLRFGSPRSHKKRESQYKIRLLRRWLVFLILRIRSKLGKQYFQSFHLLQMGDVRLYEIRLCRKNSIIY
jgi:hypothetical protein